MLDLSGVRIKIGRANTHLDDFDEQAQAVVAAYRNAVVRERDEDRSEYVFSIERVPPLDPVLGAILGDAIHNLRAALDHLAWQAVIAGGGNPTGDTNFPVLDVAPTADRYGRTRVQIAPGIPKRLQEVLDTFQPYKRGNPTTHPLHVIHRLDIDDKHHELFVTVVGVVSVSFHEPFDVVGLNTGPYEDGAEVCRFTGPEVSDAEDEFNPAIAFAVRLDEPSAGPWGRTVGASQLIRQSLTYIENEVIPGFANCF